MSGTNPYAPPPDTPRGGVPLLSVALFILGGLRGAIHFAVYRDPMGLLQIASLDVGALVTAVLGFAVVAFILGRTFASVTITIVVLGLPIAGIGALAQLIWGPHLSNLAGLVAVLGAGVGSCFAGRRRRGALLLGLVVLGGATLGLTRIHQTLESLVIAGPYLVLGLIVALAPWPKRGDNRGPFRLRR
jgi:hypothetical protein